MRIFGTLIKMGGNYVRDNIHLQKYHEGNVGLLETSQATTGGIILNAKTIKVEAFKKNRRTFGLESTNILNRQGNMEGMISAKIAALLTHGPGIGPLMNHSSSVAATLIASEQRRV